MSDHKGMDRGAHCSQGASGKRSLLLHFLPFLPCQLSWQSRSWWALRRLIAMKLVSKDFMLKLLTIISLRLPGMGEEEFTQVAVLAHQWAGGVVVKDILLQRFSWSQKMTSVHNLVLPNSKLYHVTFYVTAWQTVTFQIAVSSAFILCSEAV